MRQKWEEQLNAVINKIIIQKVLDRPKQRGKYK